MTATETVVLGVAAILAWIIVALVVWAVIYGGATEVGA